MEQWAFDILGIEATTDVRQIKKAYALLVKRYHPEEHPEEWQRIHEAYQAAMKYAEMTGFFSWEIPELKIPEVKLPDAVEWGDTAEQGEGWPYGGVTVDNPNGRLQKNVEIKEDASYGELLQDMQTSWTKEREECKRRLNQRLEELVVLKRKKAVEQWQNFFKEEFQMDVGVSELLALQRVVKESDLPEQVLRVILIEMENFEENFASREEYPCMRIAREIAGYCRKKIAVYAEIQKKANSPRSNILIGCFVCAVLMFFNILDTENVQTEKENMSTMSIEMFAAANLNSKYDTMEYNIETLSAEEAGLSDENGDQIVFYKIYGKESKELLACAVPPEHLDEDSARYMLFDNIQSGEIKNAFEESVNERTGYQEGRLFWDSSINNKFDGIEDGFFQTRYDGNFDAFLQQETEARRNIPKSVTAYLSADSNAFNGVCKYYLPESAMETETVIYEGQQFPESGELSAELEKIAADYQVLLLCSVLPDYVFEEKIEHIGSDRADVWELMDDVDETGYFIGDYS